MKPAFLLAACLMLAALPAANAAEPLPSALPGRIDLGRVTILAQPSADDLRRLRDEGFGAVVNVRTADEMAALAAQLDEASVVQGLGMSYAHVPVGGSGGWSPAAVESLHAALAASDRRVLVHCGTRSRSALVQAAYRVKYEHADPQQALEAVAGAGAWPLPLEQLSGVPLRVTRADAAPGD